MMYEKEKVWRLEGVYIESCNCNVSCPCLVNPVGNNKIPGTFTHCDLFIGYQITAGHFKDVDLAGLNVALAFYSPGMLMDVKNWKGAYYFDDRATDQQYKALEQIYLEKNGGQPQLLRSMCQEILGVTKAKIDINVEAREVSVKVGEVAEVVLDAMKGMYDDEVVRITNIHPQCVDVIQGVNRNMFWRDYNMNFDNTGRNGIWGDFIFQDNYDDGLKKGR